MNVVQKAIKKQRSVSKQIISKSKGGKFFPKKYGGLNLKGF